MFNERSQRQKSAYYMNLYILSIKIGRVFVLLQVRQAYTVVGGR